MRTWPHWTPRCRLLLKVLETYERILSNDKIWRYQHINSYAPYAQKRATLIFTLKKVDSLASDDEVRYDTAMAKLAEFGALGYTPAMLRYACQRVGRESRHGIWFTIAKDYE